MLTDMLLSSSRGILASKGTKDLQVRRASLGTLEFQATKATQA